jgi:hypothetical protein
VDLDFRAVRVCSQRYSLDMFVTLYIGLESSLSSENTGEFVFEFLGKRNGQVCPIYHTFTPEEGQTYAMYSIFRCCSGLFSVISTLLFHWMSQQARAKASQRRSLVAIESDPLSATPSSDIRRMFISEYNIYRLSIGCLAIAERNYYNNTSR